MFITASDFSKGNTKGTTTPKSKFVSAADFAKNNPPPPPTKLQTAAEFGKQIVKSVVKPIATMAARPIQLGAELLGASDEQVNQFTKDKFGDWIYATPQNMGDLKREAGLAIQTALTAGIGGQAVNAFKGANLAKTALISSAEGAGFGLGASMEQGNKILSKETAQNVALGAGLGVVAPIAIKGASKLIKGEPILNKVITDEAALKGAQERAPYTIPEAGTKPLLMLPEGTPPKPKENVIELPSPEIVASQRKINEVIEVLPEEVKSPLIKEAEQFNSRQDYINYKNENAKTYSDLIKGKKPKVSISGNVKPIPRKLTDKQLANIWNEAHTFKKETPVSISKQSTTQQTVSEFVKSKKQPKPFAPQTIESTIPSTKTQQIEKIVKNLESNIPPQTDFEHQTNVKQIEELSNMNQKDVMDVALGRKASTNGVPREAYYSYLSNLADDMANKGDSSLAIELSKSDIPSFSGQAFQALNIANKDNLTGILRDVRVKMTEKIPQAERQTNKIYNDIVTVMKNIKEVKPTRQMLSKLLEDLRCK